MTDETATPVPGAGHNLIQLLSETVNPANGSLSISITPPVTPSRGISVPFSFGYSSGSAHYVTAPYPSTSPGATSNDGPLSSGGWAYSMPSLTYTGYTTNQYIGAGNGFTCQYFTGFVFTDAQGGTHSLGLGAASYQSNTTGEAQNISCSSSSYFESADSEVAGTLNANINQGSVTINYVDVYDTAGTRYHFSGVVPKYGQPDYPEYIEDRNGNTIQYSNYGGVTNNGITVTDTAGRQAVQVKGYGTSSSSVTVSGLTYTIGSGKVLKFSPREEERHRQPRNLRRYQLLVNRSTARPRSRHSPMDRKPFSTTAPAVLVGQLYQYRMQRATLKRKSGTEL